MNSRPGPLGDGPSARVKRARHRTRSEAPLEAVASGRRVLRTLVSKATAARVLGIAVRTFERLEQLEVIRPHQVNRRGKPASYDLAVVVPAYIRRQGEEKPESPRDARDRSQAELNQLRVAKERRALLPRELVVSEGQAYVAAASAKLRALGARAVQAGLIPAERQAALEDFIEEAVAEMSRWSTALELVQAVDDESEGAAK